mmetsp:Transcript_7871/g.15142  ORF Transcript_7871/g.15142 Transcript_7871/m.15142 type:complete len:200 (+) Transcript_7871:127-726(+)
MTVSLSLWSWASPSPAFLQKVRGRQSLGARRGRRRSLDTTTEMSEMSCNADRADAQRWVLCPLHMQTPLSPQTVRVRARLRLSLIRVVISSRPREGTPRPSMKSAGGGVGQVMWAVQVELGSAGRGADTTTHHCTADVGTREIGINSFVGPTRVRSEYDGVFRYASILRRPGGSLAPKGRANRSSGGCTAEERVAFRMQ